MSEISELIFEDKSNISFISLSKEQRISINESKK